jgi:hypothetical protein
LWRGGDGLFFEVPPFASDAFLTTLHPLLENGPRVIPISTNNILATGTRLCNLDLVCHHPIPEGQCHDVIDAMEFN